MRAVPYVVSVYMHTNITYVQMYSSHDFVQVVSFRSGEHQVLYVLLICTCVHNHNTRTCICIHKYIVIEIFRSAYNIHNVYTYTYTLKRAFQRVLRVCMFRPIHMCILVYTTYIHTYTRTNIYKPTYIYTYIRTYTHI